MSKLPPVYSPAEEKTNVWTHAAGAVIALAGVIGAFFIAPPSGVAGTAGYLVYGVSLVLMYLASACYHGVSEPSRRTLLRRFDHAAIYLLIAGTYTPVLLLDDVLSELDGSRQRYLLENIHDIQTMITCTGVDDFVENNFQIDRLFQVVEGTVERRN